jgi:hypothetical protein
MDSPFVGTNTATNFESLSFALAPVLAKCSNVMFECLVYLYILGYRRSAIDVSARASGSGNHFSSGYA